MNIALKPVDLDDKYAAETGVVYLTGSQTLLRLAMNQRRRDTARGTGYRLFHFGLSRLAHAQCRQGDLARETLRVGRRDPLQPGVNEDLAATACWGSQQANIYPRARHDGIFSMWYGKGPGLDRSIDAIRHANLGGTSRHGGVLAAVGDDPAMKSTDVPAASETMFSDLADALSLPGKRAGNPRLRRAGVGAVALLRRLGRLQDDAETVDAAAPVDCDPERMRIVHPNFDFPPTASRSAPATSGCSRSRDCGTTSCPRRSLSRGQTRSTGRSSTARPGATASSPPAKRRWTPARH